MWRVLHGLGQRTAHHKELPHERFIIDTKIESDTYNPRISYEASKRQRTSISEQHIGCVKSRNL